MQAAYEPACIRVLPEGLPSSTGIEISRFHLGLFLRVKQSRHRRIPLFLLGRETVRCGRHYR